MSPAGIDCEPWTLRRYGASTEPLLGSSWAVSRDWLERVILRGLLVRDPVDHLLVIPATLLTTPLLMTGRNIIVGPLNRGHPLCMPHQQADAVKRCWTVFWTAYLVAQPAKSAGLPCPGLSPRQPRALRPRGRPTHQLVRRQRP